MAKATEMFPPGQNSAPQKLTATPPQQQAGGSGHQQPQRRRGSKSSKSFLRKQKFCVLFLF
jgi:hypothetical protein